MSNRQPKIKPRDIILVSVVGIVVGINHGWYFGLAVSGFTALMIYLLDKLKSNDEFWDGL